MICFKCDRCGEVFDGYKVDGFNGIAKIKTEKNGQLSMDDLMEDNNV